MTGDGRRREEEEMKTKLAFFDIDGTLSAPFYPVGGELRAGMTDEEWLDFCRTYGDDSYRFCKPVAPVKRYAEKLKADGAALYVLSTSQTPEEDSSKVRFIEENFPGLFDGVITVRTDAEKVPEILRRAQNAGIPALACELIEDTYQNVLAAVIGGLKGTHVSQLVWEL